MRDDLNGLPANLARSLPRFGETGRRWLADLPAMIDAARRRWHLELGTPFEPGGVTSWVAPARTPDRGEVVVKIVVPHDEAAAEAAGLAAWGGHGAVRLLDHDPATWTLLLERIGPDDLERAGPTAWLPTMLEVLEALWSAPIPNGVPTLAEVTAPWPRLMRERPKADHWDPAVVDRAIEILGTWPAEAVEPRLLHGDLHPENVLARDGGWVAIDPKPVVGDPAYDLRQVIRAVVDPERPEVGPVVDEVVAATGLERARVLGWTMAVQVESAIWAFPHDPDEAERDFRLAVACLEAG